MESQGDQQQPHRVRAGRVISSWTLARRSAVASPTMAGRFVRQMRLLRWRVIRAYLPAIVGLCVQVVLLWMAGELLDLYVSAVELWAELARKHLEIQLS
jgi:hypothetical protein